MKNIYDQRKEKQQLYILDSDRQIVTGNRTEKAAVVINLYYRDTLDYYTDYIQDIPQEIPVYICSSDAFVLETVKSKLHRDNFFCIQKDNRGRDISAFLVAAKDVIAQTNIFCFIHDKSPNAEHLREDVEVWIENLWENTLASENYIKNVLDLFGKNEQLGLLVPPEPYGEYTTHWYGDTWRADYELTQELAERLGLKTDISKEKPVFTMGTVFWARTAALKKLLEYPWAYEDFPPEPLPIDGTVSHAIERILGFVAQDAGYQTGTIVTKEYASKLLLRAQEDMRVMFGKLGKREHIHNLYQIKNLDEWERELKQFCKNHEKIYIYGAGVYGKSIAEFIKDRGWQLDGFIVSPGKRNVSEIMEIPIYELDEISGETQFGCIIGVSYEFRAEIKEMLNQYGIKNYMEGF